MGYYVRALLDRPKVARHLKLVLETG